MSVNFMIQAMCIYAGITGTIICINGTVLASKAKDFRAVAILIATTVITVILAIIGLHDLIIVGAFGLSGRIIAAVIMFASVATALVYARKAKRICRKSQN